MWVKLKVCNLSIHVFCGKIYSTCKNNSILKTFSSKFSFKHTIGFFNFDHATDTALCIMCQL